MQRLNIHNTAGLTRYAVATGITEVHAAHLQTWDVGRVVAPQAKQEAR